MASLPPLRCSRSWKTPLWVSAWPTTSRSWSAFPRRRSSVPPRSALCASRVAERRRSPLLKFLSAMRRPWRLTG
eukprot:8709706-Alexandrium_andersonii.AAC.1